MEQIVKIIGHGWKLCPQKASKIPKSQNYLLTRRKESLQISIIHKKIEIWDGNLFLISGHNLLKNIRYAIKFITKPTAFMVALNVYKSICIGNNNCNISFSYPTIQKKLVKMKVQYRNKDWLAVTFYMCIHKSASAKVEVDENLASNFEPQIVRNLTDNCIGTATEVADFIIDHFCGITLQNYEYRKHIDLDEINYDLFPNS